MCVVCFVFSVVCGVCREMFAWGAFVCAELRAEQAHSSTHAPRRGSHSAYGLRGRHTLFPFDHTHFALVHADCCVYERHE